MTRPSKDRFIQLYSRHYFDLFRLVMTLEPNRSDAEDVMQEISVSLWDKFDQYDPEKGDFLCWAKGFVRYGVLRHRRNHARRRLVLDDELINQLASEHEEEQEMLAAQRRALETCLNELGAGARKLITMRYTLAHGGLQLLAQETGKTSNALSIALYKIRRRLAKCTTRTLEMESWS